MEQALKNHLIVSNILSYVSFKEGILRCRLINKFWNEQVLTEYSKRDKIFLNLKKYLDKRQRNWHLTADSVLPKRVFVQGGISLRTLLNFFRCHGKVETIMVKITQQFWDLRTSLFIAFLEGLCPNLQHINIEQNHAVSGIFQRKINANNVFLRNLQTLSLTSRSANLFPTFAQSLLKFSPNLEVLNMKDMKSLPTLSGYGNLKELMFTSTILSKMIPKFEKFLQNLSPSLEVLRFGTACKTSDLLETSFNLPTMPKLRTFSVLDLMVNPFLLGGDIISLINEKMPALETLQIGDYWEDRSNRRAAQGDTFIHAIRRSDQRNNTVTSLSIPGPSETQLIHKIIKKFTALKKIYVSLHIEESLTWDPNEIGPLVIDLTYSGVKDIVISIYCRRNRDIVEEKAMEVIRDRCGWNVFRILRSAFFPNAGEEDGPTVRIKVEESCCQFSNLGFSNC